MTSVRKMLAITDTGLRTLLRDRTSLFFVLIFPLTLVLVLGTVFGGDFHPRIGVAAPAGDPFARELVDRLEDEDDVDVHRYDTADGVRSAVEQGKVEAGVVVPDDYAARLREGNGDGDPGGQATAEVGFLTRPVGMGMSLRSVVDAVVSEQSSRLQAARFGTEHGSPSFEAALDEATALEGTFSPVTVRATTVGEALFPESLGRYDLGASSQLLLFMFVTGLASSSLLVQARRLGVTRRMLSTPTSARVVLAGETLARYVIVVFQGVYILTVTWLVFGVDWGDPLGAVAVLLAFALVAAGAALLAGSLFRNDQQASTVGTFAGLGFAALGGSMVPLEIFSPLMRDVAHFTPHAWGNDAFAELVRRNGTVVDILPELAVLVAMGVALIALATWRLRRVTVAR
jgi:ABC-2 type transport system permease protein